MPEVAVERQLANELGLSVGDTIRLGPRPDTAGTLMTISAIYEPRAIRAEIAKRDAISGCTFPIWRPSWEPRTGWIV